MCVDRKRGLTGYEVAQAIFSLSSIALSVMSVAMSAKQLSAYAAIHQEMSYEEIESFRADAWLGISRQANEPILLLSCIIFTGSALFAALRRNVFQVVACGLCAAALGTAAIVWLVIRVT
jgi:hypothetical protein